MPIIHPPQIVDNAIDDFLASHFQNLPQRKHLANYLTGLVISENKTVAGMTADMPNASDQFCLNRFLTEVDWDENAVNEARIKWLQQFDDTKFHSRGVIPVLHQLRGTTPDRSCWRNRLHDVALPAAIDSQSRKIMALFLLGSVWLTPC